MSPIRSIGALVISVALIGGALWFRFVRIPPFSATLVSVSEIEQFASEEAFLNDFVGASTAPSVTSTTTLSNTDLIGRQLILDYVDLATSGQATEANINVLANQYVNSVPALSRATEISYADLKTVPDARNNFQNYADELIKIHRTYAEDISRAYAGKVNPNILNQAMYSFVLTFSTAYTEAALKLKGLPVPTSLAPTHLRLVNSYLSSAAAMKAVSNAEQDSATALAGLITFNENLGKEDAILNEISQILNSNGI